MAKSWVYRPCPNDRASVRLFCIPSAGRGASMYRTWGSLLHRDVEVCGVQLPGREALFGEPLVDSLLSLVQQMATELERYFDRPYAFFGHSMGAWLAFELARHIRRTAKELPLHLFLSGRRAPQLPERRRLLHELADDELIAAVQRRYGGIPPAVLSEPDLLELTLPILRADLKALETYEYLLESPISCPITCLGGLQDEQVARSDLESWGRQTEKAFSIHMLEGDHFYLEGKSMERVLRTVRENLILHLGVV